jgi:hypothetical protein
MGADLHDVKPLTNGPGAAALLAAGIGATALGVFAVLGDMWPAYKKLMIFYKPTGPLSGVTTSAVIVWLLAWAILEWRWRQKTVPMGSVAVVACALLVAGLLLTFPPFADLL